MATAGSAITKKQVQYLQIMRRQRGIDDDTWSDMKASVGAASTRDLTPKQMNQILLRLDGHPRVGRDASRPWKPVHRSAYKSGMHVKPPESKAAMLGKIEAILADLQLPWAYADGMASKMFGKERLRFLDDEQTYKVLQALAIHQRRVTGI